MKTNLKINTPVIFFKENDITIAYCPTLELSGYGKNKKSAKASLKVVLSEYFRYAIENKTLGKDLKRLGWTI